MTDQQFQFLNDIKADYEQLLPEEAAKVIPCSVADVIDLECQLGFRLPQAYREFLWWMGRGGGGFWQGSDCFYRSLPEINVWARNLLRDNEARRQLPNDSFVFYWEPTQCFDFFRTDEGDDPPVYSYLNSDLEDIIRRSVRPDDISRAQSYLLYLFDNQGPSGFVVRSPTFSKCLLTEINMYERMKKNNLGGRA